MADSDCLLGSLLLLQCLPFRQNEPHRVDLYAALVQKDAVYHCSLDYVVLGAIPTSHTPEIEWQTFLDHLFG